MRLFIKRYVTPVILAFIVANIIFFFINVPHSRAIFSPAYWRSMSLVGDVFRLVHAHYVDEDAVDYDKLTDAALAGMMDSLDDYSRFMGESEYRNFSEHTRQQYVGIGVEIELVGSRVTIVTAFEEGAAWDAGIQPGDQIVGVEETDTRNASLREITNLLEGKEGSAIGVRIYRPVEDREYAFTLKRGDVNLPTVLDIRQFGADSGIFYLRITNFGEKTAKEFREALNNLEGQGMQALIIDLRNNPGGLLRAAIDLSGEFFNKGELVVSTRGRTEKQYREYISGSLPRGRKYPVAIIINQGSASASEIVAGAMQDTGRAVIVGQQSHGKGSVQSVYGLNRGRGLRQTTAMYFTPAGRTIDKVGVTPDVKVDISEQEAARLIIQRRHGPYLTAEKFVEIFGFEPVPDQQLLTAVDVLKATLSADSFADGQKE